MSDFDHPQLGRLIRVSREGGWVGKTPDGTEIWIDDDFDEESESGEIGLCPRCEAQAMVEIPRIEQVLERCRAFLATARDPYLDLWARQEWEVFTLVFCSDKHPCDFTARFLLLGDDYGQWHVRVRDGQPFALERYPH